MGDKLANYMNQYDFEPSQRVSGVRVGRVSGKWVTSLTLHLKPGLTDDSCEDARVRLWATRHFQKAGTLDLNLLQINTICLFKHTGTYDDEVLFILSNINLMKPGLTHCLLLRFCPLTDSCCAKFSQKHICFRI